MHELHDCKLLTVDASRLDAGRGRAMYQSHSLTVSCQLVSALVVSIFILQEQHLNRTSDPSTSGAYDSEDHAQTGPTKYRIEVSANQRSGPTRTLC